MLWSDTPSRPKISVGVNVTNLFDTRSFPIVRFAAGGPLPADAEARPEGLTRSRPKPDRIASVAP